MTSLAWNGGSTNGFTLQFITSYDRNKQPFFAYLLVPDSLLPTFQKLAAKFAVNLPEFGVVLAKGPGHEPPNKVKLQIKELFPNANL